MKLTLLLLIGFCLQVSARVEAQQFTLRARNLSLRDAFTRIEKQSAYVFIYSDKLVDGAKPVTTDFANLNLQAALDKLLEGQNLAYEIKANTIFIKAKQPAGGGGITEVIMPPPTVHGRITNEKGEPVAGVSIAIKGGKVVGVSNDNGEFTLNNIADGAVLVFSGVNIQTYETKLNGRTELAINARPKVVALEDVVIEANTGYQTVKPNEATGSFDVIDSKAINQQVGGNILDRLNGVASGVLFDNNKTNQRVRSGAGNNITVRGLSTINASIDPLIVLDGFIYEGDINNINPNDVESITVLKDAAATSIWGARAGNGVIVLATKKGKLNQRMQVDVNSGIVIKSKADLFNIPQMNSGDYIDVQQFLYGKGVYDNYFTNTARPGIPPAVEVFRAKALGQISSADSASKINAMKQVDMRDQYLKYFYTNPTLQQYSVALRGGGSNYAYGFSVGYDNSIGNVYDKYKKLNIKLDNTFSPAKGLQIIIGALYTNSTSTSGRPAYGSITAGGFPIPYLRFADDNGRAIAVDQYYRGAYTDTAGAGKLLNWKYYPLDDWQHSTASNNIQELYTSLGLQYRLTSYLSVNLNYQYQLQQTTLDRLDDIQSYAARTQINQLSQINRATGVVTYPIPVGAIKTIGQSIGKSQTWRGQLNANKSWKQHRITAILGAEQRELTSNGNTTTFYGYNADPLSYGTVDFVNRYVNFVTGNQATIPGSPRLQSSIINRFISLYGNMAYTFKDRYVLSASARKDGSNVFGANTNDRWKPLWSTGLGWNISHEKFYKAEWLPLLRAKITYGSSGNVDLTKTALPVGAYVSSTSDPFPYVHITSINNPDLKWEEVTTVNAGIDFAFKNILSGSVEWFRKRGSDLYGPVTYDYTTWGFVNQITKNVGAMESKGMDITLRTRNIQTQSLQWNTTLLLNFIQSKTTAYYSAQASDITTLFTNGTSIVPVVGRDLYAIAAYRWAGLDGSGNPQGFVNGVKSTDYNAIQNEASAKGVDGNVVYVGSSSPKTFGSFINDVNYKGFSFSFNISYKLGYNFFNGGLSYTALINQGLGNPEYAQRWQKAGDENITNVPSFIYPASSQRDAFYNFSEIHVLKADNIRLQYINLGYAFEKFPASWPVKQLQCYANIANLGIIWRANHQGLDPDYPSSIPPQRSIAFGIRANF